MRFSSTTTFSAFLIAALAVMNLKAQPAATVTGSALAYAGMEASLTVYHNPIANAVKLQQKTTIAADGKFTLSLPVADTCQAWIAIRRFSAPVYLVPGGTTHIVVGDDNEFVFINTWQKGELKYTFEIFSVSSISREQEKKKDETPEINALISGIDAAYFNFLATHGAMLGQRGIKPLLREFEQNITAPFAPNSFAGIYARYSAAEMKLMAGIPRKEIYESALAQSPLHFENPAWYSFFNLFYQKYFDTYSNRFGGAEMYNRFKAGLTFTSLDSLLAKDDFLQRTDLRNSVMLLSIAQSAHQTNYPRKALKSALKEMEAHPSVEPQLQLIAQQLHAQLSAGGIGTNMNRVTERWTQNGEMPVLVLVTAPWSTTAMRDALTLKSLLEKYDGVFEVVELSIEPEGASAMGPWPLIPVADVGNLMTALEVYRVPHYVWVSPNGEIEMLPAPSPADGLEGILHRRKVAIDEANKIKVGQ